MYLWDYRELVGNLVVSDLKIKYADSMLGFAWSLLNPLMMMIILYVIFSNFYRQENFIIYLLIGILSWRFFSIVTTSSLEAIVKRESLVKKIYVPREILTLSTVISGLISSFLEFLVLIPLLVVLGAGIRPTILLFPAAQLLFFFIIYGLSLMLSSLYVYFRDLNQIWGVVTQLGFFLCPIMYEISLVPEQLRWLYSLNPVTAMINIDRDILLSGRLPCPQDVYVGLAFAIFLLVAGSVVFARLERRFAEEV